MGHKTSKLRPREMKDIQINSHFSEEELKDWYKQFMKDYPRGVLTMDNFIAIYSKSFPQGDAEEFAQHAFRTFDTNGDGVINFREFMCALSVKSRGRSDQKLRWAFRMYDLDGNGSISRDEMLDIVRASICLIRTSVYHDQCRQNVCPNNICPNCIELSFNDSQFLALGHSNMTMRLSMNFQLVGRLLL